jgi:lysozyme
MTYPAEALKIATELCVRFEGLSLKPYTCPAGKPTIGYGATYYANKKPVTLNDPSITEDEAKNLLAIELHSIVNRLALASPVLKEYPKALGALGSFVYNLGMGCYLKSTLKKEIDKAEWGKAKLELAKWVHANGKKLNGLVSRRKAEAIYL